MTKGRSDIISSNDVGGYAAIAEYLRGWIVKDGVSPGTALPKQTELATQFGVSSLTISRAMRELQDDGFVVAIRRAGTFVAESPPHLTRYVLVFPQSMKVANENRFMQALASESRRLSEERAVEIACVYGIDGRRDRESYMELVADIERQRVAGLLFATPPFLVDETPLMQAKGLARAAIMPDDGYPDIGKVNLDQSAFAERAIRRLAEMGRTRLAVLSTALALDTWQKVLVKQAGAFGVEVRPYWLQGVDTRSPECARRCMHLLFNKEQGVRPDALIVADDNLLEEATAGLVDAGIEVPGELSVIAHINFPWPTVANVPVMRLGFDAGEVLDRLLASVDAQRCGERGGYTAVTPLFEDDYQARQKDRDVQSHMTAVAGMPA